MKTRRGSLIANDSDRLMPKPQKNWDWRAASNFIAGGAGGSLLFFTAWATLAGTAFFAPMLVGLALVAVGLLCVWAEIGRPFRALNVYLHPSTSWMTREAAVAALLFVSGFTALLFGAAVAIWTTGLLGVAFLYAQARILANNKGIPAWRHPRCLPLLVSTGLAEGAGLLAVVLLWQPHASGAWLTVLLLLLVVARYLLWRAYRMGLASDGAPNGTLAALAAIADRFSLIGHAAPVLLLVVGLTRFVPLAWVSALAGLAIVLTGWELKYTLVRRAAFNQGLAMQHLPIRGAGVPGAALKPGWKGVPGQ